MKLEFIQEVIETEDVARLLECLSGWETVVFVVEDEEPDAAQDDVSLETRRNT